MKMLSRILPLRARMSSRKSMHPLIARMLQTSQFSTQTDVYIWGTGTKGQLGLGEVVKTGVRRAYEVLTPTYLEALENKSIVKLDCGVSHTAAIDDKGRVYIWGSNEYQKLGLDPNTGEIVDTPQFMEAFEGIKIRDISCGEWYTCAVDEEGKMYSWGWGSSTYKGVGGLGHEGGKDEPTPRLIKTLVDQGVPMASVECGEFHTVGLTQDGEVWAWGNGEYGRLGNGENDNVEVPEPVEFFAKENIQMIAAGKDFSMALTEDGELYSWGGNNHNQLGVGGGLAMDMFTMESIPVLIDGFGGKKVTHVACGQDHAAAITEDGRMYMWGSKLWLEPHEMTALSHVNVIAVSCGRRYTAALTECGKVFTFGKGSTNALGHGDRKSQLQPLQISSLANFNVTSINCGETHMAAIIEPHGHAADKDFSFRE